MTQREKLIEILSERIYPKEGVDYAEVVADFLIDRGVVVLPCKVGDIVYVIRKKEITTMQVEFFYLNETTFRCYAKGINTKYNFKDRHLGKTVFLTHEEAEAALKKMEGEK